MAVEITTIGRRRKIRTGRLKEKAQRILEVLKEDKAELSLALVGNREIQTLNARYRKKNVPTDVLSFPLGGDLPTGGKILGDVIISVDQAEKQAQEKGTGIETEMETLLIHGVLHLLGYDHERSAKEADRMRRMERMVRRRLCERL